MIKKELRRVSRDRRHKRIRKIIKGTTERPRLCVFRSNKNIYAQIVDDVQGKTLVSSSTLQASIKSGIKNGGNIESAKLVGKDIALKAKEKGISSVVYDRGGYLYHGKIKALADASRENGLEF